MFSPRMDMRIPSVLHQSPSIASARPTPVCSSVPIATRKISKRVDIPSPLVKRHHVPAFSDRQDALHHDLEAGTARSLTLGLKRQFEAAAVPALSEDAFLAHPARH